MKNALAVALLAAVAACSPMPPPGPPVPPPPAPPTGPIPDTGVSLSEGPCFGTCPVYTVNVSANEFYTLELGRFTRAPGTTETGVFPPGTFAAATDALRTASFTTLPTDITIGSAACGSPVVSDLPGATIGESTIAGARIVEYYPGCFGAPDRPALDTLVSDLRDVFGIPALVEP